MLAGVAFPTLQREACATELSASLSSDEIKHAASILGMGSVHRSWTAHALPNPGLGLDMGLESTFVFRHDLGENGDGRGVAPRVIPVPRFWLSWDLPRDIMVSASFAPGFLFDGISSGGLGVQYTFLRDTDIDANYSVLMHYTIAEVFDDLKTHTFGAAVQASKDLVLWQPYVGLGLLVEGATVDSRIPAAGVSRGSYTLFASHVYVGMRIDFLAKLAFQLDFTGRNASFAVLLANTF